MQVAFEVLVLLALVSLNGVLAGAEIAIVSIRKTRLHELVARGSHAARSVLQLRQHPERFLATVQIGITVIAATAGAFGGASFADDLTPILERSEFLRPHAHFIAMSVVVALISYLSLVLGELVPKSLALKASERYALLTGRPLLALSVLARPLVKLLTASSNVVLKGFGDSTNFIEARLSTDELRQLVKEATDAGTVHPQAGEIASRALVFSHLKAVDVMIPRLQVTAISKDASEETLRHALVGHAHSRLIVYEVQLDHVVGYVSSKDILARLWEGRSLDLDALLRPVLFVPPLKPAVELLDAMRAAHRPFAIVIDEHGGFAGLVAITDLIEELVGEVFTPEHDPFRREPDGTVLVEATVPVREVNRQLGMALPEGDWKTLAGLVLDRTEHIPSTGESVTLNDGTRLEVVDASPHRVRVVKLTPHSPDENLRSRQSRM